MDCCVICGTTENLHHHHIIQRNSKLADDMIGKEYEGSTIDRDWINNHPHNQITVCVPHHKWVHGLRYSLRDKAWSESVKRGQAKARAEGRLPGAPRLADEKRDMIYKMYDEGKKWIEIREEVGVGFNSISKCLRARGTKLNRIKRDFNEQYWDGKADLWFKEEQERLKKPRIKRDFSDLALLS